MRGGCCNIFKLRLHKEGDAREHDEIRAMSTAYDTSFLIQWETRRQHRKGEKYGTRTRAMRLNMQESIELSHTLQAHIDYMRYRVT